MSGPLQIAGSQSGLCLALARGVSRVANLSQIDSSPRWCSFADRPAPGGSRNGSTGMRRQLAPEPRRARGVVKRRRPGEPPGHAPKRCGVGARSLSGSSGPGFGRMTIVDGAVLRPAFHRRNPQRYGVRRVLSAEPMYEWRVMRHQLAFPQGKTVHIPKSGRHAWIAFENPRNSSCGDSTALSPKRGVKPSQRRR